MPAGCAASCLRRGSSSMWTTTTGAARRRTGRAAIACADCFATGATLHWATSNTVMRWLARTWTGRARGRHSEHEGPRTSQLQLETSRCDRSARSCGLPAQPLRSGHDDGHAAALHHAVCLVRLLGGRRARAGQLPAAGHLSVKDQRRQDRIVSAPDDDRPFVLNVESAFWITGPGTVIVGSSSRGSCISVITSK
jgi:hypothetical protein